MAVIRIKKGLDLPLAGVPDQTIESAAAVSHVALLGDDYPGMRPTMVVKEGDTVKRGQLIFTDKKTPGVVFTSPGGGTVVAINRGAKRRFESFVVKISEGEEEEVESFTIRADAAGLEGLERESVRDNLVASGLWTALRTRPFGKVPAPGTTPVSIFVTAIDTAPLAPDPAVVIASGAVANRDDFLLGQIALARLTDGPVYVCRKAGSEIPVSDHNNIETREFSGPHPAGLPGTHIHFVDPVQAGRIVWSIGYQDVIAIGALFRTGRLHVDRVVSLAGPAVAKPRLLRTRIGAAIEELTGGEFASIDHVRVLSGDVLTGRVASETHDYLGRCHRSICALPVETEREFLNWLKPGSDKFSVKPAFAGALRRGRRWAMNTSNQGSGRAMVPIGMYEKILPHDILPTFLLRALSIGDDEQAEALGCLELDEEDLALCSFVCPGKTEYGPLLRDALTRIEKEG